MNAPERLPVFPLVRHISKRATPWLAGFPVTPNQITAASLVTGLATCWCLAQGDYGWALGGGVLFVITYVLDNCDGEIARLKGQVSSFGHRFDTFVDGLVHSAFFIALGIGVMRIFGSEVWLWLGVAAGAIGAQIYWATHFFRAARKFRA